MSDPSKHILAVDRRTQSAENHIRNDAEMFGAVCEELQRHGFDVARIGEDDLSLHLSEQVPSAVISMAQRPENVALLAGLAANGCRIVNDPVAVTNTYRTRLYSLIDGDRAFALSKRIDDVVWLTDRQELNDLRARLDRQFRGDYWLKRGDIHAAHPDDVVRVTDEISFNEAIASFQQRGVDSLIAQRHYTGDVVKFYGVVGRRFFVARDGTGAILAGEIAERIADDCDRFATTLGLDIYGGDVVLNASRLSEPKGAYHVIDLNAWPSFSGVYDSALAPMVDVITQRFAGRGDIDPSLRNASISS
jgi:hypothetical protein